MKLFLSPVEFNESNGIGQVIKAQRKYLPEFGIELVDHPGEADLKAAHIWSPLIDNEILFLHGLEWNGDKPGYEAWHGEVNQVILESAKTAWAITVPSEWVAMPFKRDLRLSPEVIPHGLNLDEWKPLPIGQRSNYILYNKNREDTVCSSKDVVELARRGFPVVSTFGKASEDMLITGPIPHEQMKEYLKRAGVYASFTKETFGIGILEALACGVPVLGYAYGGNLDLIQHKVNGYLVEPDDIDGLEAGYHWLMENREAMQPAIATSLIGRDWKDIIGRYARLFKEVYERKYTPRTVSVVITNYNYQAHVIQAINSALNQSLQAGEIIVVDDGSTDNSRETFEQYDYPENVSFIYQDNQGVAAARNNGIAAATGHYIVCLDADDWIEPTYVETLFKAMEADRALGVAYTGLQMHFENGESSVSGWPPKFDFNLMAKPGVPPPNTIPCAAMFRKEMWERAGGYKQEYAPGEDVEFWLRGLSVGFNAKKVTDEPLFNYRMHGGSASRTKQYKDITADKPWVNDRNLMPIGAPTKRSNLVRSYSEPLVSVIIPVGPGHVKHVRKAVDSLLAQTFKNWEVIVIRDFNPEVLDVTKQEWVNWEMYRKWPFVKSLATSGAKGAGYARNIGIAQAKAPLLFFLDADDYLMPSALEDLVRAYTRSGKTYVFSDWYAANPGKELEHMNCPDYNQEAVREKIQHAVSVLVETEAVRAVGGFDESLETYEDWDFFLKLASRGYCGTRVPKPLLVYRTETGTRRLKAQQPGSTVYQTIKDKWKGVEFMPCCGQSPKIERVAVDMLAFPPQASDVPDGKIRMRYLGAAKAGVTYLGKYQVADDDFQRTVDVNPEEVSKLLQLGVFQEA